MYNATMMFVRVFICQLKSLRLIKSLNINKITLAILKYFLYKNMTLN